MKSIPRHVVFAFALAGAGPLASASAEDGLGWNQFRGPSASGIAPDDAELPAEIGPGEHLLWKTPVGKGHSSPVVHGRRVYLTTLRDGKLFTLALDTRSGRIVWQREAPCEKLESVHRIGSPATPSVATDGERVYSFFGSAGFFCYDRQGNEIWHRPMGPFDNQFGAASSPVLAGDWIVTIQDHDNGSFLAALDKRSGRDVWRTERPEFRRSYGTPALWNVDGRTQIVTAGSAQVTAYDLQSGKLVWHVRGVSRVVNSTPVVGDDGNLYVANSGGGTATAQPSFADLIASSDADGNRLLEAAELPGSPIKGFFGQFDRDKNGSLDRREYESIREIFSMARAVALSIRPGGRGDVTESHVRWEYTRSIPRNPTPLVFGGHLYMVNDGGVLTCLATSTGELVRQGRLGATGKFFSSPVVGDGKVYAFDQRGDFAVVTAEPRWRQLAAGSLGEDVYATPAIAGGRIYVRTVAHLYCFGYP